MLVKNANNEEITQEIKQRPRFDMYVVVKEEDPFVFNLGVKGIKKDCTLNATKFYPGRIEKWLPYLIKIADRYRKRYKSVELYDNSKQKNDTTRIILKMNRGKVERNLLPDYGHFLKDFPLPEYLSYEIKPE